MRMKCAWTWLLAVAPLFAAVDGTVIDATTGKPVPGISVSLVQPGDAGMQSMGETKSDGSGKFAFAQDAKGPVFIQAVYQGVTYMKTVMPGTPASGVQVEVYDSTKKDVAKVSQHMLLLQPNGTDISVSEMLLYQDDTKLTFNDHENGSIRFYVPPGAKDDVKATIAFALPGGASIPIQREVEKTKQANIYKIDYPLKPGETRVDITYTFPEGNPAVFPGRILHKEGKARLVVPNGVEAKSDSIKEVGKEPQTQATVYDISGDSFQVELRGTGSIQAAQTDPNEDQGQPQIQESPPPVYEKLYWLLGLAFAVLGLGTYLLLRHQPPAASAKR